jgi:hypothetical protein
MSLLLNLNRSAATYNISGPLWFKFSQEFALSFSSWLNSPLVTYSILPAPAPSPPITITGTPTATLATYRVPSRGFVANGPLGIKTEAALLQGINRLPCGLKPLAFGTGSGFAPILPSGLFLGPSLGNHLTDTIPSVSLGFLGRSWLFDFGTRLQAGLSLSGGVTVASVPPVPAPPVVLSLGCICPL